MNAAAGAAAAAGAVIQATRASGVIVRVYPREFMALLHRAEGSVVVHATSGVFSTHYDYLTSYKGLAFFTRSQEPLRLPSSAEVIKAKKIWIPS